MGCSTWASFIGRSGLPHWSGGAIYDWISLHKQPAHNGPPQRRCGHQFCILTASLGKLWLQRRPAAAGCCSEALGARARTDRGTHTHTHTRIKCLFKKFPMTPPLQREKGGKDYSRKAERYIYLHSFPVFLFAEAKEIRRYIHIILFWHFLKNGEYKWGKRKSGFCCGWTRRLK